MPYTFLQKGLNLLLKRQTNILSAALIIMATVVLSQLLGLVRQRLLVSIFGASNDLGVYLASVRLPDLLFQLIIAGALSSAFIPVFSDLLAKKEEKMKFKIEHMKIEKKPAAPKATPKTQKKVKKTTKKA